MECNKTSYKCVSFWCGDLSPVLFLCLKSSWCWDAETPQVCQAGTDGEPRFHNPIGAGCMGSPGRSCTWNTYQHGDLYRIYPLLPSMHWPLQFSFPHHGPRVRKMRARTQDTWSEHRRWQNLLTPQQTSFQEEKHTLFLLVVIFLRETLVLTLSSPLSLRSPYFSLLAMSF